MQISNGEAAAQLGITEVQLDLLKDLGHKLQHDIMKMTHQFVDLAKMEGLDGDAIVAELLCVLVGGIVFLQNAGISQESIDFTFEKQRERYAEDVASESSRK